MNRAQDPSSYILGLDIGVSSIGWALIGLDERGTPHGILKTGVHTFEAGVEGDVESGRDEARGAVRRQARMPRRMFWRRQRRRRKILRLLQRAALLPPGDIGTPQAIHDYLLALDAELRRKHPVGGDRVAGHVLPYRLRAAALDRPLEPTELGRALYHLAQRRGFLSNRKSLKKDEDEGVVKQGITELQAAIEKAGARTLGEYFAGLDPEAERIRRRWTARQMYVDEFNRIWDVQAKHHPGVLTDVLRKQLYHAIFFQRPLKSMRHLIGRCELVPTARRAAMADRLVQRFRILQKVNDLEVIPPDASPRPLKPDERVLLIEALCRNGDLTFAKIKSKEVLGALTAKPQALPKGTTFNFEQRDEEKKLPGHRTDEKMREVFGGRWDSMPESERDAIVLEVLSFQKPDALQRRAMKAWGLDFDEAKRLSEVRFEQGYASHSRTALRQLVARMQDGTRYATARRELFPDSFKSVEPVDRLPPVTKSLGPIRNPAVERALSELRKLVNEIVRVYGKPVGIRVELARDLKRARKERERKSREIDEQTKAREKARARILAEAGIAEPRRSDIEKALLWEECGGLCPYTGRSIEFSSLFGANPQFDVEHIIPFSRSLDNSFLNKTLCYHEENRDRKRNRTPFEAYESDPKRYSEILARVRRFHGKAAAAKLRRFEMREIPEDFVTRQLNDTRYAATKAAEYLGLLYGGRTDAAGKLRIQASAGGLTAHVRNEWMLNSILDDGGQKTRDDHRHHAVDALVVALTSPAMVKRLQEAAERASAEGRRLFARVQEPWAGFLEQAREKILAVNVSARLSKKIAGDLHEDTNYSKEYSWTDEKGKTKAVRHVRKPIDGMTEAQVEDIVDPIVREKVREWVRAQAGKSKKDIGPPPTIKTRDGREIPIKTVRVRKAISAVPVGKGPRTRYVKPGSNHHSVIVAVLDKDGNEIEWEDHPVTRLEVHQRKATGQPIIQKAWGPDRRFKFTLAQGEYFLIKDNHGTERLWRCTTVSQGDNWFRLHADARTREAMRDSGDRALRASGDKLRKRIARKVRVTYLGEIVPAND